MTWIHTSYLSMLGHHHTIQACKRGTKKCVNSWQNSQKWLKFSVFYAKRGNGIQTKCTSTSCVNNKVYNKVMIIIHQLWRKQNNWFALFCRLYCNFRQIWQILVHHCLHIMLLNETSLMQAQKDRITQKSRVSDCLANMDQSLTTVLSSFEIPTIPARCRGILQRYLRALTSRFPRDPD